MTQLRWIPFTVLALLLAGCGAEPLAEGEICANEADDDADGLADCADSDCAASCPEVCGDGLDNDGDLLTDCADPVCDGQCAEACDDGRDNDGDGLFDCADDDCVGQCPENCTNGVDDDGDQAADCFDADCSVASCAEQCTDGRDNDANGLTDCDDPACDGACAEDCADGRDNDGDNLIDCDDPHCDGSCAEDCADGRDNDLDGDEDCEDQDCDAVCDADGDGFQGELGDGADCDDAHDTVYPSAPEGCDGLDNDCDGLTDDLDPIRDGEGQIALYTDSDLDGYGLAYARLGCMEVGGLSANDDDCNDLVATRNPGATEVCNNADDDCDGLRDDSDPSLDPASMSYWYEDIDGDDYGDATTALAACDAPSGYVDNGDDCHIFDDRLQLVRDWWLDLDADGYGAGDSVVACAAPIDRVDNGSDCNDSDDTLNPETVWYLDADLDGFGDPDESETVCVQPLGYIAADGDCDDGANGTNPAAIDVCDNVDNDCDGILDAGMSRTYYLDQDADGIGDPDATTIDCSTPVGFVEVGGDNCPAVANVDQVDGDLDGFGETCECDDADAGLYPGGLGYWPSLVGAWFADGDASDETGTHTVGTLKANTTYTEGVHGEAFLLDGLGDSVAFDDVSLSGVFTVAFWVRADALGQSDNSGVLSSSYTAFDNTFQISTTVTDQYQVHTDLPSGDWIIGEMSLDWVHVAMSYDGTYVNTYYNGTPAASAVWIDPLPPEFTALRLGTNRLGTKEFEGAIDHVLLFDSALGDAEVASLYDDTAVCDDLCGDAGGMWYLDGDGDGYGDPEDGRFACTQPIGYGPYLGDNCLDVANADQIDLDSDGYGAACDCDDNDAALHPWVYSNWPSLRGAWLADYDTAEATGQMNGATLWEDATYTPGVHGQAFTFDGFGDWAYIDMTWSGPFSLALWVRADELGQSDNTGVVSSSFTINDETFQVSTLANDQYQVHADVAGGDYVYGDLDLDWVHLVMAYDGTDVYTWRDGVPGDSGPWNGVNGPEFTAMRLATNRIGTKFFAGAVDDLLLFDRKLTDDEVTALFEDSAWCLPL